MDKKFHEIKLTDLTCGWEEGLQEARRDFPEGTFMIVQEYSPSGSSRVFYDPVGTYNIMIDYYNNICAKVKAIIDKGIEVQDLPKLLQLDILLYDIVLDFMIDQEYSMFVNYKTKEFKDLTPDFYGVYLDEDCFELGIEKYKMF